MYWFLFLLLTVTVLCGEDLVCPNHFHIRQDPALRMFHIFDDQRVIGSIVSSNFGVLDFYDHKMEQKWVNHYDSLFDMSDNCIGSIKFTAATQWFWERKNLFHQSKEIAIFSSQAEFLATFDAEGEEKCFVFRDPENRKPLAIALWSWIPDGIPWFSSYDYKKQDWEVIIVDRSRIEEKKIPFIFLIWVLLKHSQRHFPNPDVVPYLDKPPTS